MNVNIIELIGNARKSVIYYQFPVVFESALLRQLASTKVVIFLNHCVVAARDFCDFIMTPSHPFGIARVVSLPCFSK